MFFDILAKNFFEVSCRKKELRGKMKINSINGLRLFQTSKQQKAKKQETNFEQSQNSTNVLANSMTPVFMGSGKSSQDVRKERELLKAFTPESEEIFKQAETLAKISHSETIEDWHLYLSSLIFMRDYLNALDEGSMQYDPEYRFFTPRAIQGQTTGSDSAIKNPRSRKKIEAVIEQHIEKTKKEFLDPSKELNKPTLFSPRLSKEAIADLYETFSSFKAVEGMPDFIDSLFLVSALSSRDKETHKESNDFIFDVQKALGIQKNDKQKAHLTFYDNNADIMWKNIAMNNDVMVVYDLKNKDSNKHLVSSFTNLIHKPNQTYKNVNPDKTDVIVLNDYANFELFDGLIERARKNKDKKTVIVADFNSLLVAGPIQENGSVRLEGKTVDNILNLNHGHKDPNVRVVFLIPAEVYASNTQKGSYLSKAFETYNNVTLPVLNAQDATKYLTDEKGVEYVKNTIGANVPKETIAKAVELTAQDEDEHYPQKALNLLNSLARYNVDNKELTPELLEQFVEETKKISEATSKTDTTQVILNSPMSLKDIIGTPMTKADAENIVSQIKKGTFKTKGYTIFQSNGSSYGGGRFHVAQAIAGEAKIPMFVINAKDFALKEWDAQSQNADFSEMKIKRIVQAAKAQAEANPNKTAMIFVKNFDNFGSDPLYGISSAYEQKAFNQLLEEMEQTRKEGKVNLLVMGSVNRPETLDENILKPYKFLNSVVIYPPYDTKQTKDVFEYYIDKMGINLEAKDDEEKEELLTKMARTVEGSSPVDIMYMLEIANAVIQERNKDKVGFEDFVEAFLQATSGRANVMKEDYRRKEIVTAHETGHAIVNTVMEEIAKENGLFQELPNELDFITLDPRGNYGGANYFRRSENGEINLSTVISELATSYGGHSVEKIMYGMDGSWGITGDAEMIGSLANQAVTMMGMGKRTGVRRILPNERVSEAKKEAMEKDIDEMCEVGKFISDTIVRTYRPFIEQFTQKHAIDAGTGKCLIPREQFEKELEEYRATLTPEDQKEIQRMKEAINGKMEALKTKQPDHKA